MMEFPKTVLWEQKRRWGKWKKWAVVANNIYELRIIMDKIQSLGDEARFKGTE